MNRGSHTGWILDALTVTVTGRLGFTVIVIELEVAGLLEVQSVLEEVSTQ